MEWTYRISAAARPKVLMRVVQVFDHQLVAMRRCSLDTAGELLELEIAVDIEQQLAQRIHAKLYKKLDLLQIDLIAGQVPSLDKQTALLTMPKI
jgi:acetolactate synthase regulatory subunit